MTRLRTFLLLLPLLLPLMFPDPARGQIVVSYPFNGNAQDASGNGVHGTVFGAKPTFDRFGNSNSAYSFDGVDDYIQAPSNAVLNFSSTTNFSVSAWVKFCSKQPRGTNAAGPYVVGMGKGSATVSTVSDRGYALTTPADVQGGFYHVKPNGNPTWETGQIGSRGLDDGKWHHLVGVTDVSVFPPVSKLYIDGVETSAHQDGGHDYSGSTLPLLMGKSAVDNFFFKGAIDDVKIYAGALSPAEVSGLYTENGWPAGVPTMEATPSASVTTPICVGDSVQLQAQASGPYQRLVWVAAGGLRSRDTNAASLYVLPVVTTTYTLELYGGIPCEDKITRTITVQVSESPKVALGGPKYLCKGDSVAIGSDATGGKAPYSYVWSPATAITSTSTARPKVFPTVATRYYVTVTDANGCKMRDSILVNLFEPPQFDLGPDRSICRGTPTLLNAEPTVKDNYKYAWAPKAGLDDSTIAAPTATPAQTTKYMVTVTSPTGCIKRDTILLTVKEPPTADAGADLTLCADSSIVIGRKTGDNYTYAWTPVEGLSDPASATPSASPDATTTYTVTVTDGGGCTATDQIVVTLIRPGLASNPTTLDFGELDGCTSSLERTLTLTNSGDADLSITELLSSDGSFSVVSPAPPFDLKKGSNSPIVIRYAPPASGSNSGTLLVRGSAVGASCVTELTTDLAGRKLQALVATEPTNIDFGKTLACDKVEIDTAIVVRNNGTADVTIADAIVGAPFTILSPTFSQTIAAGGSLEIRVRYAPTAPASVLQDLRLPYSAGECRDTMRIALSGLHELPELTSPSTSLDFGTLSGCQTSGEMSLTVTNTSTRTIDVSGAQLPPGFRIVGGVPASIPAGGSHQIVVRFEPSAPGNAGGDMNLSYEPCARTLTLPVTGVKQGVSFATPDTVNFGRLISCAESTKSIPIVIGYSSDGAADGTVGEISLTGPFTTTLTQGAVLRNGVQESFQLTFTPTGDGIAVGTIDLTLEPCGVKRRIEIRADRVTAALSAPAATGFGTQPTGIPAERSLAFVNSGAVTVGVERIEGIIAPFSLVSTEPVLPADLAPGETLKVTVRFTPTNGAAGSPVRVVAASPCDMTAETTVDGTGEAGALAVVTMPTIRAAAGERLRAPILLTGSTGLDVVNARAFEATISFDRTLLVAADRSAATNDDKTRRMTVRGERRPGSDTLGFADLIAVLGSAQTTPLTIETFEWTDALADVTTTVVNGEFQLDGICREGGVRLYDGEGEVILKPNRPNPAGGQTEIEYEVVEQGRTRLYVADMLGRRVAMIVDDDLDPGRYIAWFDAGGLAAGVYMYILETPTLMVSGRMEVAR